MVIGGSVRPASSIGRFVASCSMILRCSAGPNNPARAAIGITYANTSPNTMITANCHPRRIREPRKRWVNKVAEASRHTSACDRKLRPRLASPSNRQRHRWLPSGGTRALVSPNRTRIVTEWAMPYFQKSRKLPVWVSSIPSIRKKPTVPTAIPARTRRDRLHRAPGQHCETDEIQREGSRRDRVRPQHADVVHQAGCQERDPAQGRQHQRHQVDSTVRHQQKSGHEQQAHHRQAP